MSKKGESRENQTKEKGKVDRNFLGHPPAGYRSMIKWGPILPRSITFLLLQKFCIVHHVHPCTASGDKEVQPQLLFQAHAFFEVVSKRSLPCAHRYYTYPDRMYICLDGGGKVL